MRSRFLAGTLALATLVATGVGFSGASFSGGSSNPDNSFATAESFGATVTMLDPGANLRDPITLEATVTGTVVSVTIQSSPAGADSWSDACPADTTSPYQCSPSLADGPYDFRAIADDGSTTIYSDVVADRLVDNTAPSAAMVDPGAYLRGVVALDATASDGTGSGVASVSIEYAPDGGGSWTTVCTDTTSPYSCSLDTVPLPLGLYDFHAVAIDVAGNPVASAVVENRWIDNEAPTVTMGNPGSPLRGTVTLGSTVSDGPGSGIASVAYEYKLASGSTWSAACSSSASPFSCSWNTTGLNGTYDLRAVAADNAGNQTTSAVVANRVVDNTAPTATDVQTTNGGSTAGQPEPGDLITFTYSEQIAPASILAGWNGSSTSVTARIADTGGDTLWVYDSGDTILLALTTSSGLTLGGNYARSGKTVTFSATMVQSGASITVTLGSVTANGNFVQTGTAGTMSWPPSTSATDLAGNPCSTTAASESGGSDAEF